MGKFAARRCGIAAEPQRRAFKRLSLGIEDRGALLVAELEFVADPQRAVLGVGCVYPSRQLLRDLESLAQHVCAHRALHPKRLREPGDGPGIVALVDAVDGYVVAPQAFDHRAARWLRVALGEQPVSLPELAEVGALERGVDEELNPIAHNRAVSGLTLVERFEIGGGVGVIAGVVTAIAFGQRDRGIERHRLDSRIGLAVADRGGGHRNLARHSPIGNQRTQGDVERRAVSGEPFGKPADLSTLGGGYGVIQRRIAPLAALFAGSRDCG